MQWWIGWILLVVVVLSSLLQVPVRGEAETNADEHGVQLFHLGTQLRREGRRGDAHRVFVEVLEFAADGSLEHVNSHHALFGMAVEGGDYEEAETHLAKILGSISNPCEGLLMLSDLQRRQGKVKEELESTLRACDVCNMDGSPLRLQALQRASVLLQQVGHQDRLTGNATWASHYLEASLGKWRQLISHSPSTHSTLVTLQTELKSWIASASGVLAYASSTPFEEQDILFFRYASSPSVQTVCETTFQDGAHTLTWLYSNPMATVISFDDGPLSNMGQLFVEGLFPRRLRLVRGNTTETLPRFVAQNIGNVQCDLVVSMDRGRPGDAPYLDLRHLRSLSHRDTIVMMGDLCTTLTCPQGARRAWERMEEENLLRRIECYHSPQRDRGFCVGSFRFTVFV